MSTRGAICAWVRRIASRTSRGETARWRYGRHPWRGRAPLGGIGRDRRRTCSWSFDPWLGLDVGGEGRWRDIGRGWRCRVHGWSVVSTSGSMTPERSLLVSPLALLQSLIGALLMPLTTCSTRRLRCVSSRSIRRLSASELRMRRVGSHNATNWPTYSNGSGWHRPKAPVSHSWSSG